MARSLRIKYPGAWYHVMHRASDGNYIFNNPNDFFLFLDRLSEAHHQYKIEIHAYCLMNNHYHLLVRTPCGNLSDAMRHINGIFTQKYNRLHEKDGALFRGRYKAILVEKETYLLELSRYIHLNPIAAGIAIMPEDYPWSSYNFFANEKLSKPTWLYCEQVFAHFNNENKISEYIKFVLEGIGNKCKMIYAGKNRASLTVLGSDEFISAISKKYVSFIPHEDIPECQTLKEFDFPAVEDLISVVSTYFSINPLEIIKRPNRKKGCMPRKIALYLAFRLKIRNKRDICKVFEGISYNSVGQICRRVEMESRENVKMFNEIEDIKKILISKS